MVAICMTAMLAATPATVTRGDEAGSGLRGVVLMGPVAPGPVAVGQADEAPFSAGFTVLDADGKVAHFESAADGRFELALPPGDYTIVPDATAPIPYPRRQQHAVTVPATGYAEVTLRFDTGMR
jgi:hypothetical protein